MMLPLGSISHKNRKHIVRIILLVSLDDAEHTGQESHLDALSRLMASIMDIAISQLLLLEISYVHKGHAHGIETEEEDVACQG